MLLWREGQTRFLAEEVDYATKVAMFVFTFLLRVHVFALITSEDEEG